MTQEILDAEKQYLANLLEAIQPRNLAAHDYETRYREIANHFNALHQLRLPLYRTAKRLLQHCRLNLGVMPISNDFSIEFAEILGQAK